MVQNDLSSGVIPVASPVGNTWRSLGSSFFNQANIAAEDWQRDEQSAILAFQRDMEQMDKANQFSANEAQKARDFERLMRQTAYQDTLQDMQKAGINPVLAYSQGATSSSSGVAASSSAPSRSFSHKGRSYSDPAGAVLGAVTKVLAGALTDNPGLVVSGITDTFSSSGNSSVHVRRYSYSKNK